MRPSQGREQSSILCTRTKIMKELFIEPAKQLLKERRILTALAVLAFVTVVFVIYVGVNIHPSELKLVTHYTAFGSTNFYRDTWFYLISFVIFGIMILIGHTLITLRLLAAKGSELALGFVWATVVIIFIAGATAYQVLRVAALA